MQFFPNVFYYFAVEIWEDIAFVSLPFQTTVEMTMIKQGLGGSGLDNRHMYDWIVGLHLKQPNFNLWHLSFWYIKI